MSGDVNAAAEPTAIQWYLNGREDSPERRLAQQALDALVAEVERLQAEKKQLEGQLAQFNATEDAWRESLVRVQRLQEELRRAEILLTHHSGDSPPTHAKAAYELARAALEGSQPAEEAPDGST